MRKRRVGVTARSRQNEGNQVTGTLQFGAEMAAPLEMRTPAGTCGGSCNQSADGSMATKAREVNEQKNDPRRVSQGKEMERGAARYARLRLCLKLRQGASPLEPQSFRLTRGGLLMEAATVRERFAPPLPMLRGLIN